MSRGARMAATYKDIRMAIRICKTVSTWSPIVCLIMIIVYYCTCLSINIHLTAYNFEVLF